MKIDVEGNGHDPIYYVGICLERLRKTTKNSVSVACLQTRTLERDEYEATVLTPRPKRSVKRVFTWRRCSSGLKRCVDTCTNQHTVCLQFLTT